MVGFYVDVGYCGDDILTSLSDVTFTDYNRPYIIPTALDYSDLEGSQTAYEKHSDVYEALKGIIGSDVDNIYSFVAYSSGTKTKGLLLGAEEIVAAIPSLVLAYPNLYSHIENLFSSTGGYGDPIQTAILFKSTNRLVQMSSLSSGSHLRVYSIDGDSLSPIYNKTYTQAADQFISMSGLLSSRATVSFGRVLKKYDENVSITSGSSYSNYRINLAAWGTYRIDSFVFSFFRLYIIEEKPPAAFEEFLKAVFPEKPDFTELGPQNPYEPGGPSGPSDIPPGTFDDTSDPIPIPPIPTVSAADTGFTRIYNPTLSQVQDLARYLWTDTSVIETIWNHIKQFFESPMEAIIGFNLVPCRVPDGGAKNFALMFIDTGVSMNTAATQFVDVDCGTVKLDRYYGSALDQSPYTKVSCFLPYIGMVQLNTDEVMGATLGVTYRIDIVSGSCVAMITVDGNVLYQYSGHCAITIPFSAADFSNYVSAAISVAKLAIGAAVGGGIGAIASAGIDPEQQTNIIKTTTTTETVTTNALTGSERRSFSTKVKEEPIDSAMTSASFLGLTPRNISNTVGEVVTSKPHVEHSGSFSGNSGYLGVRRPYLIIERPRMCMPEQYQRFNGFPAMYTQSLSSCSGFTQVQQVQLTGMTATNPEQSEILQLLKSGVIL